MTIDWASFTPASAAVGGLLVGLGSVMLLLLNGRVAGVSGIVGGLFRPSRAELPWRIAFIAGLVLSPILYAAVTRFPDIVIAASYPTLIAGGLLVGFGTRLGSGCTSGHGICGVSRLSMRSIVAVLCFCLAGFATVFVVRHVLAGS